MNFTNSPKKLFVLCVDKIADGFRMPLSQGEWERRKYTRAVSNLPVTIPDYIVEIIVSVIFGKKL